MSTRRGFLFGTVGLSASLGALDWGFVTEAAAREVARSDAEWRSLLTPAQYSVLRQDGTERPFSSPLNNEHRQGVFSCAGCRQDLFSSATKFDSRTGWPSFFSPLSGAKR